MSTVGAVGREQLRRTPSGSGGSRGYGGAQAGKGGGTITRRVARILALPAVVILLLLSLVAAGQIQDFRSSQSTSTSVKLALAVQDLVHELQTERGLTAGVLGGNPSFRAELTPSRKSVDAERVKVEALVRNGGDVETQVSTALQQLDGLDAVRAATDATSAGRAATFKYFTDRISALSAIDVGLDNTSDSELRQGVAALQALQDLTEAESQERAFLNGVFSAGGFAKGEFVQFAAMRADKEAALTRYSRFATPSQLAANDFVYSTGAAQETTNFEQVAIDAADGRHIVVNPQSWWSGLTTVLDDLHQLQQHIGSQIQIRAHALQQGSTRQIGFLLGVVALCFIGSIYLATLASLSITRPLAALAAEADSVAAIRLPEAVRQVQADDQGAAPPQPPEPVNIPRRATEEIRSVAGALDRLQSAAYGLATEQAVQRRDTIESLANLGRRNQNLIRRQLGFITSLEREEIDPAQLANLFELDHLATRMRRNAASLLVLVEASSPRQWSSSVPVADVIRAAVSEVEEYRRVSLRRVDDALVTGSAIGSIAHLLSELIENALTFSPPDTEVEVQGRHMGDGYLVAITDQGVGMSTEDLRQANARLRGEGDFIAAPTRFLGHFVVGKLARDTSVNVELLPSPVTGVTARVTLPASLLTSQVAPAAVSAGIQAQAITADAQSGRHADAFPGPAQISSPHLLALPPLDEPVSAQTADPWNFPGASRPFTAPTPVVAVDRDRADAADRADRADRDRADRADSARRVDPDQTPASGIPLAGVASANTGAGNSNPRNTGSIPRHTGSIPRLRQTTGPRQWATASDLAASHPIVGAADRSLTSQGGFATTNTGGFPTMASAGRFPSMSDPHLTGAPSSAGQPAGAGSGGSGGSESEADRTRNGLRKRTPRSERASEPTYTSESRRIDLDRVPARPAAVVDQAPADVSARLTALRAGLQRGKAEQVSSSSARSGTGQGASNQHEVEESE